MKYIIKIFTDYSNIDVVKDLVSNLNENLKSWVEGRSSPTIKLEWQFATLDLEVDRELDPFEQQQIITIIKEQYSKILNITKVILEKDKY